MRRRLGRPPYLSGDPEPTDYKHFEICAFSNGVQSQGGMAGETASTSTMAAHPTCS